MERQWQVGAREVTQYTDGCEVWWYVVCGVGCVPDGVEQRVPGAGARGEEGPPPPAVVLVAQLEVAQQDGDLGARRHLRRGREGAARGRVRERRGKKASGGLAIARTSTIMTRKRNPKM